MPSVDCWEPCVSHALVEGAHACFRTFGLWTEHLLLGYRVAGLASTGSLLAEI